MNGEAALDSFVLWFCSLCQILEGDFCKPKDFRDWKNVNVAFSPQLAGLVVNECDWFLIEVP